MKTRSLKIFLVSLLCVSTVVSSAQDFAAFQDYRQRFFAFHSGQVTLLETLAVKEFKVTKSGVVYRNNQNDLMIFTENGKEKIEYNAETLQANDVLIGFTNGSVVKAYNPEDEEKTTLTLNRGNYWVGDDVVVYENAFQGTMHAFESGRMMAIASGIFDSKTSKVSVGENIVMYRFSNSQYKVYWNHKIYDIITYNGNIKISCGRDMAAFNDPITNTFVLFHKGQLFDVETQPAQSFAVGDNLLAYVDASGNFKVYDPNSVNDIQTIANYGTTVYSVKDNVIAFFENGWLKYYNKGEVKEIVNYEPQKWDINENNLVYIDINGMLKGVMEGEEVKITTEKISGFQLFNNCVVVNWINETSSVYWKGEMYDSY